jgi:hypothetical protein
MKTIILTLTALMGFNVVAVADMNAGMTVEWVAHQSAVIAIAVPEQVENFKSPDLEQVWFTKTCFTLKDVIKGPQRAGDRITIYDYSHNTNDVLHLAEAVKTKKALLVFCTVAEDIYKEIDGQYVFTEAHTFKSAYYQDAPVTELYTPDFHFLKGFGELLKRTRSQVAYEAALVQRHWNGTVEKEEREVPDDSEIFLSLFGGSECDLWVPEYKEEGKKAPPTPQTVQ